MYRRQLSVFHFKHVSNPVVCFRFRVHPGLCPSIVKLGNNHPEFLQLYLGPQSQMSMFTMRSNFELNSSPQDRSGICQIHHLKRLGQNISMSAARKSHTVSKSVSFRSSAAISRMREPFSQKNFGSWAAFLSEFLPIKVKPAKQALQKSVPTASSGDEANVDAVDDVLWSCLKAIAEETESKFPCDNERMECLFASLKRTPSFAKGLPDSWLSMDASQLLHAYNTNDKQGRQEMLQLIASGVLQMETLETAVEEYRAASDLTTPHQSTAAPTLEDLTGPESPAVSATGPPDNLPEGQPLPPPLNGSLLAEEAAPAAVSADCTASSALDAHKACADSVVWEACNGFQDLTSPTGRAFSQSVEDLLAADESARSRAPKAWSERGFAVAYASASLPGKLEIHETVLRQLLGLGSLQELMADYTSIGEVDWSKENGSSSQRQQQAGREQGPAAEPIPTTTATLLSLPVRQAETPQRAKKPVRAAPARQAVSALSSAPRQSDQYPPAEASLQDRLAWWARRYPAIKFTHTEPILQVNLTEQVPSLEAEASLPGPSQAVPRSVEAAGIRDAEGLEEAAVEVNGLRRSGLRAEQADTPAAEGQVIIEPAPASSEPALGAAEGGEALYTLACVELEDIEVEDEGEGMAEQSSLSDSDDDAERSEPGEALVTASRLAKRRKLLKAGLELAGMAATLDVPLKSAKFLTAGMRRKLEEEDFFTLRQLLEHYPKTYVDYSNARQWPSDGGRVAVVGRVEKAKTMTTGKGMGMLELLICCDCQPAQAAGEQQEGGSSAVFHLVWQKWTRAGKFGSLKAVHYLRNLFPEGTLVSATGKVKELGEGKFQLDGSSIVEKVGPAAFKAEEGLEDADDGPDSDVDAVGRTQAVYTACGQIGPALFSKIMARALPAMPLDVDPIPLQYREQYGLLDLSEAYRMTHSPDSLAEAEVARKRLVFDEFFYHQLSLLYSKHLTEQRQLSLLGLDAAAVESQLAHGRLPVTAWSALPRLLLASLPFELTAGQMQAAAEILYDLQRPVPMSRLLQGDVGCGKTVVALLALLQAVDQGLQGAIMAPTEFLAHQHFHRFSLLLEGMRAKCKEQAHSGSSSSSKDSARELYGSVPTLALLTGSSKRAKNIRASLESGEVSIAVGTHALFSRTTDFHNLGMVVVDEQHRFGVRQREALVEKGKSGSEGGVGGAAGPVSPHVLTMSATPIPRSLALALHGDMALSQITMLPSGRPAMSTRVLLDSAETRAAAYKMVREAVSAGRGQAFVVFPLVEDSEEFPELRSAVAQFQALSEGGAGLLSGVPCTLLHGRMGLEEKEEAMQSFRQGDTKVLVCTTVIEVGIDIPAACAILVEHAERYGMAQLHQLRGRVGRSPSAASALCLLLTSSRAALERLQALESSTDGFLLAEMDLKRRGHGELLGQKQSGHLPEFLLARYDTDGDIMHKARALAETIIEEHRGLQDLPRLKRELSVRRPAHFLSS